jgi:hypothetical protein
MKRSLNITLAAALLGAGLFTGTRPAQAALLAYEGFDYAAGNVNGANGGTGWNGAWTASPSPVYESVVTGTPLSYSGGSLSLSGSGTALSITGGTDGILNRGFVGTGSGTEIYFAFLFQSVSGSGNEFIHFYLSDDSDRFNSGGIGDFFTTASDAHFGVRTNDGSTDSTAASSLSYTPGTTYLLVGRLSTDGSAGATADIIDQVDLWVNPTSLTPGLASVTVNASTGLSIGQFDTFSSRMVNFSDPDQILIDELRIGTDFASVVTVPEPSTGLLLALGGLGLLALRRRASRPSA